MEPIVCFDTERGMYAFDLTNDARIADLGHAHHSIMQDAWYRLDDTHLCTPAGHTTLLQVADLLDVSSQITLLDRICPRPRRIRQAQYGIWRGWRRQFTVTLGVREPDRWRDPRICGALERLLTWMTEDEWQLTFQRQERRKIVDVRQAGLLAPTPDASVILFSGGLDSLAGTVALLESSRRDVVLTSVTHRRLTPLVRRLMADLQRHYGAERIHIGHIPFELTNMQRGEEYTQRTRGFRFLACGAAQAIACGLSTVAVCENGVGSINLPYNWRQLGAQHTRATHPTTLGLMSALLSVLQIGKITCTAPHQFRTKGELCQSLAAAGLGNLAAATVSCDSFPIREEAPAQGEELHCGECTSCLLRRQALFAAGLAGVESAGKYLVDVCSPPDPWHPNRVYPLKMMLDQVTTIERCLAEPNPTTAIAVEFPELAEAARQVEQNPTAFGLAALSDVDGAMNALSSLLHHYATEWRRFPYCLEAA